MAEDYSPFPTLCEFSSGRVYNPSNFILSTATTAVRRNAKVNVASARPVSSFMGAKIASSPRATRLVEARAASLVVKAFTNSGEEGAARRVKGKKASPIPPSLPRSPPV